ncbi:C40 family peptidase [Streptomyces sp. NPDC050528]|uniref:C40 family peptidase n=1 Tax=Streptomyces sp. NPDC050528 TaxID=3365623 RepID=UPI00378BD9F0
MASSHRKPRSAGKRIAGIWIPAADDGNSGLGEVERKIDDLYRRAESATEKYNAAKERATRQRKRYRIGPSAPDASTFQLADTPHDHFDQAQLMSRLPVRRRDAGNAYAPEQSAAGQKQWDAAENPRTPDATQSDLGTAKATVQKKLATARELLSRLTAQNAQKQQQADTAKSTPSDSSYATKAAKAIAFARAQVGKPYVWGAAGPGSYDCSGLTQAAWRAAGVTLPRATSDQANAGTTVPLADAQPGDLVFFHADSSHVGVYVGDGMMIHAPKPGTYVREESVHSDDSAIVHSVVRPA